MDHRNILQYAFITVIMYSITVCTDACDLFFLVHFLMNSNNEHNYNYCQTLTYKNHLNHTVITRRPWHACRRNVSDGNGDRVCPK